MKKTILLTLLLAVSSLLLAEDSAKLYTLDNWWEGGYTKRLALGTVIYGFEDGNNTFDLYNMGFPAAFVTRTKKNVISLSANYQTSPDPLRMIFGSDTNSITYWFDKNNIIKADWRYNREYEPGRFHPSPHTYYSSYNGTTYTVNGSSSSDAKYSNIGSIEYILNLNNFSFGIGASNYLYYSEYEYSDYRNAISGTGESYLDSGIHIDEDRLMTFLFSATSQFSILNLSLNTGFLHGETKKLLAYQDIISHQNYHSAHIFEQIFFDFGAGIHEDSFELLFKISPRITIYEKPNDYYGPTDKLLAELKARWRMTEWLNVYGVLVPAGLTLGLEYTTSAVKACIEINKGNKYAGIETEFIDNFILRLGAGKTESDYYLTSPYFTDTADFYSSYEDLFITGGLGFKTNNFKYDFSCKWTPVIDTYNNYNLKDVFIFSLTTKFFWD
ncbi:MAG: hypothetical protein CVV21_04385 [Candidatus Goldiibacteriota bacterium HGW-Goldbacteria-1]|nr:MAG: hypothetical protein CVV21_04385 [Candidatus Goldiibacteriota bacterium HGW-Goldbacteria-1]